MDEKKNKSRGLGRGLSALMADVNQEIAPQQSQAPRKADMRIPIERVHANPDQPRRAFNEEALKELANSIAEKGVIQPIIEKAPDNRR